MKYVIVYEWLDAGDGSGPDSWVKGWTSRDTMEDIEVQIRYRKRQPEEYKNIQGPFVLADEAAPSVMEHEQRKIQV